MLIISTEALLQTVAMMSVMQMPVIPVLISSSLAYTLACLKQKCPDFLRNTAMLKAARS